MTKKSHDVGGDDGADGTTVASIAVPEPGAIDAEEGMSLEDLTALLTSTRSALSASKEEVASLSQQLATSVPRAQALQQRRDLEDRIDKITKENQNMTETCESEVREREWLEGELRAQYEAAETTEKEMQNLQNFVRKLHDLVEEKGNSLNLQKEEREGMGKQLEEAKEEVRRLRKEADNRTRTITRLEGQYKETSQLAKVREEESSRTSKEATLARRQYDQLQKVMLRGDAKKAEVDLQLSDLKGRIRVVDKVGTTQQQASLVAIRKAERQNGDQPLTSVQSLKLLLFSGTTQQQASLVAIREAERQNVDRELHRAEKDIKRQDNLIQALHQARDKQVEETSRVEARVMEVADAEEAQRREAQRALHTQALMNTQLHQLSALSDALKTDNYIATRQLRTLQTEKEEVEEDAQKADYVVKKLQQNLNARDKQLEKMKADLVTLESEEEKLRTQERASRKQTETRQAELQYVQGEKMGLTRVIHDQEDNIEALKDQLEEERKNGRMVATQLARRNDEVRALRERVRLLEHILNKGDKDYTSRLNDLGLLTNEVKSLRNDREVLTKHVKLVEALKLELVRLQRELIGSQNKRALLEEEVSRREKAHSWHTLKVTEPTTFELMRKTQMLQKRLITATQRAANSEAEANRKSREVEELRRAVARAAEHHPEAGALRAYLTHQARAKEDQIKSVTAALNAALLAQEEGEQERRNLRQELNNLRRRMNMHDR
ncbi:unnamed protein product, partial [Meganyctiphanes norvegica]